MEGLTAGSGFRGDSGSRSDTGFRVDAVSGDKSAATNKRAATASDSEAVAAATSYGGRGTAAILRRELIFLGIALICGFLLVPLAVWAVGNRILGPYTHLQDPTAGTGPMRLLADYYDGLAHGWVIFWCVGFGPYVLLSLIRLIYGLLRRSTPAPST
jgi:hypothetical protein